MKILSVIQCSNLGGMEKATLDSLSELHAKGHDVRLFSLHPVGELKTLAQSRGIALGGTKKYRFFGLGNIQEILREASLFRPDRIWLVGHNFGSLFAAAMVRCPVYLSIHYHHSEHSFYVWRCFYGCARRICSSIHFVSQYIFDEVADLLSGNDRVHCFPNVLAVPKEPMPRDEARKLLSLKSDDFVVGNAGWLIPRKAFDVFLSVAAIVHRKIPKAIFLIAGDGPEREKLGTMAMSLGLDQSVRFLGWNKNLHPFYSSLDTLLFNSHVDCLGMTPLEGLMYGVPVVCSVTHGGLKEFLRHGQDGYLVDTHDVRGLAEEIIRIYENRTEAKQMAQTGRQHVLHACSLEKHMEHLNTFLEIT